MASIIQKKRLINEVKLLSKQPLHYCTAYPDESNPLIWYFLIMGQKGTDYYKGEYIGKIVHSPKYPAEPPDYYMLTPSGRYNIGAKICLTNSSYHKGDWSSTWNILSILIAFYSIWLDDKEHGISHIVDSSANRKKMAANSVEYNLKNNYDIYMKFDRTHLLDDDPKPVPVPVPVAVAAPAPAQAFVGVPEPVAVPVDVAVEQEPANIFNQIGQMIGNVVGMIGGAVDQPNQPNQPNQLNQPNQPNQPDILNQPDVPGIPADKAIKKAKGKKAPKK